MEDARGVTKVIIETRETMPQRWKGDQFMGFSGSLGPSQKTMLGLFSSSEAFSFESEESWGLGMLDMDSGKAPFSMSFERDFERSRLDWWALGKEWVDGDVASEGRLVDCGVMGRFAVELLSVDRSLASLSERAL